MIRLSKGIAFQQNWLNAIPVFVIALPLPGAALKLTNDDLGAVIVCYNEKLVIVFLLNTITDY